MTDDAKPTSGQGQKSGRHTRRHTKHGELAGTRKTDVANAQSENVNNAIMMWSLASTLLEHGLLAKLTTDIKDLGECYVIAMPKSKWDQLEKGAVPTPRQEALPTQ